MIHGSAIEDAAAHAEYVALWAPLAAKYGARNVTKDKALSLVETRGTERLMLVEFTDIAAAQACYDDPDYQVAKIKANAGSQRDLVIFAADIG